ncbi:DNA polymerase delta subunit 4 [Blumeria hordei DH14]|uniref:DNA polymerase delta subunit 4 n=1 Tax=Blumeria graminis f. sp. hordei (strain DH14) TaxID=546991 RepID=N1JNJ6_BLUG1|nr:DNA polymerase delta subunit 4 [Blumeria hordei DH14]
MPPATRNQYTRVRNSIAQGHKPIHFGGSKITKPRALVQKNEKSALPARSITQPERKIASCKPTNAQQNVSKPPRTFTPIEQHAHNIPDSQIKEYWRLQEQTRIAPSAHQADMGTDLKILWLRANRLGLSPPIEVLAVLLKGADTKGARIERAHVDELMIS